MKNSAAIGGELAGARTQDPNIKSVVLYLLSYEFIAPTQVILVFGGANVVNIFILSKKIHLFSINERHFDKISRRCVDL